MILKEKLATVVLERITSAKIVEESIADKNKFLERTVKKTENLTAKLKNKLDSINAVHEKEIQALEEKYINKELKAEQQKMAYSVSRQVKSLIDLVVNPRQGSYVPDDVGYAIVEFANGIALGIVRMLNHLRHL